MTARQLASRRTTVEASIGSLFAHAGGHRGPPMSALTEVSTTIDTLCVADLPTRRAAAVVSRPSQLRALANDVRIQMVGLLRERAWTMAELGAELGLRKGSVSYHLRVLEKAGIAAQVEGQTVRGGAQQRWALSAPEIDVRLGSEDASGRAAVVRVLSEQMTRAAHPRLFVSHVRLDDQGRARAVEILESALADIEGLRADDGVLTTLAGLSFDTRSDVV